MAKVSVPADLLKKMRQALELQRKGDVQKAQKIYKAVLKKAPDYTDAIHLLGVTYRQLGFPKRAIDYIRKAISLSPDKAPYYANLARALTDIPGTDPKIIMAAANTALKLNPTLAEAKNLKGIAMVGLGLAEEAEEIFKELTTTQPSYSDAFRNYGTLLSRQNDYQRALTFFDKAVELGDDSIDTRSQRLHTLIELGGTYIKKASTELDRLMAETPNHPAIVNYAARLRFHQGRHQEGIAYAKAALKEAPHDVNRMVTLGALQVQTDAFDEAIINLTKARRAAPAEDIDGINAIGWNLSLAHLGRGDLEEGWDLHDSRFHSSAVHVIKRVFDEPQWQGENISDKTLLLWFDQGIGDVLRAATMVREVIRLAKHVIIEAPGKLVAYMQRNFPETTVRKGQFDQVSMKATGGDFDLHSPLIDLARFFRRSFADFSHQEQPPYTCDKPKAQSLFKDLDVDEKKPIVGVGWRSKSLLEHRARYYLSAPDFAPIMDRDDVTFVDLQYASVVRELEFLRTRCPSFIHLDHVNLLDDIEAAASLTACCDLVISANTSVAEIAGGLGVPCWRFGPNESVLLLGQSSPPWYPTTRYLRLPEDDDAVAIVPELVQDLESWRKNFSPQARIDRLR